MFLETSLSTRTPVLETSLQNVQMSPVPPPKTSSEAKLCFCVDGRQVHETKRKSSFTIMSCFDRPETFPKPSSGSWTCEIFPPSEVPSSEMFTKRQAHVFLVVTSQHTLPNEIPEMWTIVFFFFLCVKEFLPGVFHLFSISLSVTSDLWEKENKGGGEGGVLLVKHHMWKSRKRRPGLFSTGIALKGTTLWHSILQKKGH